MKNEKQTTKKLKNKYHEEYVYCNNINEIINDGTYKFIRVFKQDNPSRVFLVNKEAYDVVKM
jgi:hypothetical protein